MLLFLSCLNKGSYLLAYLPLHVSNSKSSENFNLFNIAFSSVWRTAIACTSSAIASWACTDKERKKKVLGEKGKWVYQLPYFPRIVDFYFCHAFCVVFYRLAVRQTLENSIYGKSGILNRSCKKGNTDTRDEQKTLDNNDIKS